MKHHDNPLTHKAWKPLLDETSRPFDQTNGATATTEEPQPQLDERLLLLERGAASNSAMGFGPMS